MFTIALCLPAHLRISVRTDQYTQREVERVANETSYAHVSKVFRSEE